MGMAVVLLLFIAGVGGVGYYYNQKGNADMTTMYANRLVPIKLLNENRSFLRYRQGLSVELMLANLDSVAQQKLLVEIKDRQERVDKNWQEYLKTELDPYEKERIPKVKAGMETYLQELAKAMIMANAGQKQEAYVYYSTFALDLWQ